MSSVAQDAKMADALVIHLAKQLKVNPGKITRALYRATLTDKSVDEFLCLPPGTFGAAMPSYFAMHQPTGIFKAFDEVPPNFEEQNK